MIKCLLKNHLVKSCVFSLLLLNSAAFAAPDPAPSPAVNPMPNSIETLDITSGASGKAVVKLTFKEPLTNPPAGFTISNPPRIAFDFSDTENALGKNFQDVGQTNLRSLNIVQAGNRTRLVLNLLRSQNYETQVNGKTLLISLQSPAEPNAATSATTSHFAEAKPNEVKHALRDVDFRRGKNGEARILADLSDNSTGIDIHQQGKNLIIDFIKTSLPRNLERRMDVNDFATPVQIIDTFAQGDNVRMVIEPKGLWEHSAYQAENRFILEIKPIIEDPNKLIQGNKVGYTGEKLSLNFQNVEVRSVLQVIADFTGLNIITSDSVGGNLTLRLKDVPWDQALDIILQSKGLDMRKNGNVILIAPRDELAAKEKLDLEARAQITDLEPLRTETFQLNYMKAEAFSKILSDDKQKILSKRGSAVWDPRTNILFIQDTPSKLEEIRRIIARTDIAVRQVMIEARIVEATDNFSRNIGVRLGYHDLTGRGAGISGTSRRAMVGGNLNDTGFHTGQSATDPIFPTDSNSINLPAQNLAGFAPGVFSMLLFNQAGTKFLNLELSALEADNKGKIISSPRVITADQIEATIEQGTEIPYQQATSSGATSVSFRKATLSLKVKPQITPDQNIIMDLKVNKDAVGQNTVAGPSIDTKQVTTQALVENGGTVVIGGIYTQDERTGVNKVPLLGDIPVLGHLFKNTEKVDNKTELLIFVTPRIIKDTLGIR